MADYKRKLQSKAIAPETPQPQPDYLQASVLMIDNRDGGVLAMVGGRDFVDSMYNRATQSRRPVGTAFTPFVFAAAFQKPEYYPPLRIEDGLLDNRRVMIGGLTGTLGEWGTERDVTNYDKPDITAREALLQGRNAATVRLGERVGLEAVKDLATKAGIKSPLREYPSTFLGASEARLDEMCLAFSSFANGGRRPRDLLVITRITDEAGKVVHQLREDDDRLVPVMDEIAAYQTHSCLVDALKRGTGRPAYEEFGLENFPAAGKTGTHYEFKDLWFVGYTSAVTCGVWCGFDQQKPVYIGAFSNRIALPVWVDAMNAARKEYKPEEIPTPESAQIVEVCRRSGLRATDACYEKVPDTLHGGTRSVRDTFKEVLRRESLFDHYCDVHTSADTPGTLSKGSPEGISLGTEDPIRVVAGVVPIRMQALPVIGEDPFNSVQPPPPKATPVDADGVAVPKAKPVEEESPTSANAPIKLKPPPPIKLDP
jgi:penicillin-binding protein 1A